MQTASPQLHGHCLVAVYPSHTDANTVRERLINDGIPATDIRISDNPTQPGAVDRPITDDGKQSSGLFSWLWSDNVPEDDRSHYQRHLGQNRAAISVYARTEDIHRKAADLLLQSRPIALDDKSDEIDTLGIGQASAATSAPQPIPGAQLVGAPHREFRATNDKEEVIPVVKEELEVAKRADETHRRIRVYTVDKPVEETVMLRDETVTVERRPATGATSAAPQDRTIDITERHETAEAQKHGQVTEEVVVHRDVREHPETVRGTVKETRVEVEGENKATDKPTPTRPTRPTSRRNP